MHGTATQPEKAGVRSSNKLQAELATAREKLVEAISERAPEPVLRPLRNKVGFLWRRSRRFAQPIASDADAAIVLSALRNLSGRKRNDG